MYKKKGEEVGKKLVAKWWENQFDYNLKDGEREKEEETETE